MKKSQISTRKEGLEMKNLISALKVFTEALKSINEDCFWNKK